LIFLRGPENNAEFEKKLDFGALEIAITKELAILGAALQKALLTASLLSDALQTALIK